MAGLSHRPCNPQRHLLSACARRMHNPLSTNECARARRPVIDASAEPSLAILTVLSPRAGATRTSESGSRPQPPHAYFASPSANVRRFLLAGEGDVPPLTYEVLRRAEPDLTPAAHAARRRLTGLDRL